MIPVGGGAGEMVLIFLKSGRALWQLKSANTVEIARLPREVRMILVLYAFNHLACMNA
jgi:hypothetical protein